MNLLPIADRELRVAARLRSTFWLRVAAALTGLVIGGGCLILTEWEGASTAQLGGVLFSVLSWLCLAAALGAGLFFTSDCLSEEKRDGTMGLLFLTDLRGYDVVIGKLLATSLRGFYALLAVLPILAITQLMGGITGPQYWKTSLALSNALFCSLAAGMLISSISRDSQKAMAATLFVLVLLTLGGPLADLVQSVIRKGGFRPLWSMTSPGYVLTTASAWGRSAYWQGLLITEILGWTMLALACWMAPRSWQDRRSGGSRTSRGWSYAWKYGGPGRLRRLRLRLLEREPITWLACRERWQSLALWVLAVLAAGSFLVLLSRDVPTGTWILWNSIGGIFVLFLYLWVASQAVRFLVEARRSGLAELLLVSPIGERQITRGQWRALLRMFGLPLLLLLGVQVSGAVLSQLAWHQMAGQVATATTAAATSQGSNASNSTSVSSASFTVSVGNGTNSVSAKGVNPLAGGLARITMAVVAGAAAVLATAGNLLALFWFGMWMGLTSRSPNLATLKTIVFVQVIPWFAIAFVSTVVIGLAMASLSLSGQPAGVLLWWPLLSAAVGAALALAKDVAFIAWSRNRLYTRFRETVSIPTRDVPLPPPILQPARVVPG